MGDKWSSKTLSWQWYPAVLFTQLLTRLHLHATIHISKVSSWVNTSKYSLLNCWPDYTFTQPVTQVFPHLLTRRHARMSSVRHCRSTDTEWNLNTLSLDWHWLKIEYTVARLTLSETWIHHTRHCRSTDTDWNLNTPHSFLRLPWFRVWGVGFRV